MSTHSKSKYTPSLNIYSMTKAKDISAKIKTVSVNPNNDQRSGISGINSSAAVKDHMKELRDQKDSKDAKDPNSNSFRQTGIISMKKFKTTKHSRKKI
jgi:hypothetical protein